MLARTAVFSAVTLRPFVWHQSSLSFFWIFGNELREKVCIPGRKVLVSPRTPCRTRLTQHFMGTASSFFLKMRIGKLSSEGFCSEVCLGLVLSHARKSDQLRPARILEEFMSWMLKEEVTDSRAYYILDSVLSTFYVWAHWILTAASAFIASLIPI